MSAIDHELDGVRGLDEGWIKTDGFRDEKASNLF